MEVGDDPLVGHVPSVSGWPSIQLLVRKPCCFAWKPGPDVDGRADADSLLRNQCAKLRTRLRTGQPEHPPLEASP